MNDRFLNNMSRDDKFAWSAIFLSLLVPLWLMMMVFRFFGFMLKGLPKHKS